MDPRLSIGVGLRIKAQSDDLGDVSVIQTGHINRWKRHYLGQLAM